MLIAIPLLDKRVAPRCVFADSILIASLKYGRITVQDNVPLEGNTSVDLVRVLTEKDIQTFICGGISESTREALTANNVAIIENVTGTAGEIIEALPSDKVKPGFGFGIPESHSSKTHDRNHRRITLSPATSSKQTLENLNCLTCNERVCLNGENCMVDQIFNSFNNPKAANEMLESAMDVAFEDERKLCRVAELVYYCLGMKYKRIGVAFCIDLLQPATILTGVLQRFFRVIPVCCKVGGLKIEEDNQSVSTEMNEHLENRISCNPVMQAEVLNRLGTDMNVIVGLCVGVDSVFTSISKAPVTTIFVKDKSLANNPIGAIYSDYYLNDI